jgi:hypothetical protein
MASASGIRAGAAYIELGLNDSALLKGLQAAAAKLQSFGASLQNIGGGILAAGSGIVAPLLASVKTFADMGDALDEMSQRTGVSVETLSALGYAAKLTGADLSDVETALKFLQKNLANAASGSKEANANFAQLGLSVAQLQQMSPEAQFEAVSKALGSVTDQSTRTQLAMSLLGRSGTMILPMTKDIAALKAEAERLGMVMSTQDAKAAAELSDTIDRLWMSVKMAAASIGSALAPVINEWGNALRETATAARKWVQEHADLVRTALGIGGGLVAAGAGVYGFGLALSGLGSVVRVIGDVTQGLRGLVQAAGALAGMNLPTTILSIATGFAGATQAVKGLATALKGLSFGSLLAGIATWAGSWKALGSAISIASKAIGGFIAAIARLAAPLALVAIGVERVWAILQANSAFNTARQDAKDAVKQCEKLNQQLERTTKAAGGGNDMTFEKATDSVDQYIQSLIEAGKTREEIMQLLEERREAEAVRKEATTKQWTPKNALSEENYSGIQNESTQWVKALDEAISDGLNSYSDMFDEVAADNRKLTQQMMSEEAKRTGVLRKALEERGKALKDFQKWLAGEQRQGRERDDAEQNRQLSQTDPLQAVKQASDAYAKALAAANEKVASAEKILQDALATPESDVRRNEQGHVEIGDNPAVENAVAAAKEAYQIAEAQKELLRDATRAAIDAQARVVEESQNFQKRYAEGQQRRGEGLQQRQFEQQLETAKQSPEGLKTLETGLTSQLTDAAKRARDLKSQSDAAFALARQSEKKTDLERAKAEAEKAVEAQDRIGPLVDRLLAVGGAMDAKALEKQTFDVAGTFSASALDRMGFGSTAQERTAKATEETVKRLDEVKRLLGGESGFTQI